MSDILLFDHGLVSAAFADAGLFLFGALIFFFGIVLTLTVLIKKVPQLVGALIAGLCILLFLLLGIVLLDLSGVTTVSTLGSVAELSATLSTHRWLVIQLPFLLIVSSIISLCVYGQKITERHAHTYYLLTTLSIWLSFAIILLIGCESMI